MAHSFQVGEKYARVDVADAIGMPESRRGGNWHTGYDRWNGEFFIFCNIGIAGRTGHDYANRWYGPNLIWYGKSRTTASDPEIQDLTSGRYPVHIFWRCDDRAPFTYAGRATPAWIQGSKPVEITWLFDFAVESAGSTTSSVFHSAPQWRRGPPPTTSEVTIYKQDGPASTYLMTLHGANRATFPNKPEDMLIAKVGMSNDPDRRLFELNYGFAPGCTLGWQLQGSRLYPSGRAAFEAEGALLERMRLRGRWIGGEFIYAEPREVSKLLH